MAKIRLTDFSGGKTDDIFGGDVSKAQLYDNLMVSNDRKMLGRWGSALYDLNRNRIPAGDQRIGAFFKLNDTLFIQSKNNIYYDEIGESAFQTLVGPSSGSPFSSMEESNYASFAEWNGHVIGTTDDFDKPVKIYRDTFGEFQLRTAGLPELNSDPTITPDADDSKNYLYRFLYFYEYTVGDLTFNDYGATRQVAVENSVDFSAVGHYNQISDISALAGSNYDTDNVKIQIYRTVDGDTTFFYVGEVDNGTTTFEDTVKDEDLVLNAALYTEGGVYDNDTPPNSKYAIVANDMAWYLNIQGYNYRVRQAIKGDPDSCPEEFYVDLEDEIIGGGVVKNIPIIMTKTKIYRLDGYIDFTGSGDIFPTTIHRTAGCVSHRSIVNTGDSIYWAGNDGFYWSDGYNVAKISDHLNDSYDNIVFTDSKKAKIYGSYDPKNNLVYFSVAEETENDTFYILNERFMKRAEDGSIEGCFTTWSGGDSFAPTAILVDGNKIIRGDSRGYILKHESDLYNDPEIDTSASPEDWKVLAITPKWKHIAFDFGASDINKWINKIGIEGEINSNLSIQLNSYDNGTLNPSSMKEIRYTDELTWGDPDWVWEDEEDIWNQKLFKSFVRRPVKGSIRTRYKQLEVTNSNTIITTSKDHSTANVNFTTKQLTLTDTDYNFPDNCDYYEIRYETSPGSGSFSDWYEITDRVSDTVIEASSLPSGSNLSAIAWEIRGYDKNQRIQVNSITFTYEALADVVDGAYYRPAQSGGISDS